ncbi:hypothetical protein BDU57DRAFT_235140 [Ampelomyces quisqualis]|uniref:Uncharacterized protein n=1 Tax=Ampelomyces quisqualis TaxID=50730 RepID=A0A6A5QM50_AMPQU|nr:hypothetical protein BDU57DRAFT_235140 [Ampelomyces quisqualis]
MPQVRAAQARPVGLVETRLGGTHLLARAVDNHITIGSEVTAVTADADYSQLQNPQVRGTPPELTATRARRLVDAVPCIMLATLAECQLALSHNVPCSRSTTKTSKAEVEAQSQSSKSKSQRWLSEVLSGMEIVKIGPGCCSRTACRNPILERSSTRHAKPFAGPKHHVFDGGCCPDPCALLLLPRWALCVVFPRVLGGKNWARFGATTSQSRG